MAVRGTPESRRIAAVIRPLDHTTTQADRDMAAVQYPPGHPVLVERWGCQCATEEWEPTASGGIAILTTCHAIDLRCPLHTVVWSPSAGKWVVAVRHTRTPEPEEDEAPEDLPRPVWFDEDF